MLAQASSSSSENDVPERSRAVVFSQVLGVAFDQALHSRRVWDLYLLGEWTGRKDVVCVQVSLYNGAKHSSFQRIQAFYEDVVV